MIARAAPVLLAVCGVVVLPACPDGFGFGTGPGFVTQGTLDSAPKELTLHVEPGVQQRFHVPLEFSGDSFDAAATLEVLRSGGVFLVAVSVNEADTQFIDRYTAADSGFLFSAPVLDPETFTVADGFELGVAGAPDAAAFDVDVRLTARLSVFDASTSTVALGRLEPRTP